MGRPVKKLGLKEKEFCRLRAEGLSSIQAARMAFGWRCEPDSAENQKARDLIKRHAIKQGIKEAKELLKKEAEAALVVTQTDSIDTENLIKFAYNRLRELRDDKTVQANQRVKAIEYLEKLSDPSKDINLIWRWIDIIVRGATVHCPCCHGTFPAEALKIPKLEEYRNIYELVPGTAHDELFDRRNAIISLADKRYTPHSSQRKALSALERHIVGLGAARAGKSYLMALFALLYFLCPGSEVWILARIYDDARSEVEYLENFIQALFYPLADNMVTTHYDSKTNEWTMKSRWGSELKVKSAKAQGSLTGRELDALLAAEPGWLPDNIYHHIRARLSSRLGRIIALGTPQGMGGFISRMVFTTGRDLETGKMKRLTPEERLLSNGATWDVSALVLDLNPKDNPSYVKSELNAARREMSDEEYAAEFEGRMVSGVGMKFHAVAMRHLRDFTRMEASSCDWVLGVDQGDRNFGVCLIGYDGKRVYVERDLFDNSFNTIKTNMLEVMREVPLWIRLLGGDPTRWRLTIFDQDPPVANTLDELERESNRWPTPVVYRHDNKKRDGLTEDWRKETAIFINEMAKQDNLVFGMECAQLHDEVMRTENIIDNRDSDGTSGRTKGWKISGSWRKDHVLDAFMFALWTILSQQVIMATENFEASDPLEEAKRAFEYNIRAQEEVELSGYSGSRRNPNELFSEVFGRPRSSGRNFVPSHGHNYDDA